MRNVLLFVAVGVCTAFLCDGIVLDTSFVPFYVLYSYCLQTYQYFLRAFILIHGYMIMLLCDPLVLF